MRFPHRVMREVKKPGFHVPFLPFNGEAGQRHRQEVRQYRKDVANNRKVARQQEILNDWNAQAPVADDVAWMADRVVDAENFGRAALGTGLATLGVYGGAHALGAYNDQQSEGRQTDFLSVAGRAANNGLDTTGFGGDPLAAARARIQESHDMLGGNEELTQAVLVDQLQQAAVQEEADVQRGFIAAVDQKAQQLMSLPSQNSQGTVEYMDPKAAYQLATDMVNREFRANGYF